MVNVDPTAFAGLTLPKGSCVFHETSGSSYGETTEGDGVESWLLLRENDLRLKLQELNCCKLLPLEAEIKGLEARLAFLDGQMTLLDS